MTNIVPHTTNVSKCGVATKQFAEVNALVVKASGTVLAKIDRPLDTFGATTDVTTGDATTSKHGLMPKADRTKLDTIETSATADQTNAEIATAYAAIVAQISAGEITAGTGTSLKTVAPADLKAFVIAHAPANASTAEEIVDAVGAVLATTDTITPTYDDAGDNITFAVNKKTSSLTAGTQGQIGSDSAGIYNMMGTGANVSAAGNDARFLTTDEKAAITASASPAAGNALMTQSAVVATKIDDFATPDDNTDLDASTSLHGLMSKNDKIKLDAIELLATADQTGAQIKVAYEAENDTNAYTDAAVTKLGTIETSATADQTDAEIATAYGNEVAQISAGEITAGTVTALRTSTPADLKAIVLAHAPGGGVGSSLQTVMTRDTGTLTTSAVIPLDDTIPTSSEGAQLIAQAITPTSGTSKLLITVSGWGIAGASAYPIISLFRDVETAALDARMLMSTVAASAEYFPFTCVFVVDAGGTSEETYKVRVGVDNAADSLKINLGAAGGLFGSSSSTLISIQEIGQ
tara:strand:- start:18733 stop:20298 length:1566 start_codon:yes stop_codon:yes gene_type:complete